MIWNVSCVQNELYIGAIPPLHIPHMSQPCADRSCIPRWMVDVQIPSNSRFIHCFVLYAKWILLSICQFYQSHQYILPHLPRSHNIRIILCDQWSHGQILGKRRWSVLWNRNASNYYWNLYSRYRFLDLPIYLVQVMRY